MASREGQAGIALNRFGLGALRGNAAPDDPRGWLHGQCSFDALSSHLLENLADSRAILDDYRAFRDMRRDARQSGDEAGGEDNEEMQQANAARRGLRQHYELAAQARLQLAATSHAPFAERLAHFWANHFAVSAEHQIAGPLAGAFEAEAIRPHVFGNFADMLLAVESHPAMLAYLDQANSIGPQSTRGQRIANRGRRQAGFNENLGREILELHTLGVRSGYTQADVRELALALTGWTIPGFRPGERASGRSFAFDASIHEPGARQLLGQRFAEAGEGQARSMLGMLARHPATARHLAIKLARHFSADDPADGLLADLERAFLDGEGDLPRVYAVLIDAEHAWHGERLKFRTPFEWMAGAMRALGEDAPAAAAANRLLRQLGQSLWRPGSPAGFPDEANAWAAPDALYRRVETASRLARNARTIDARQLAGELYPDSLSMQTRQAVERAESGEQALALLLASPEAMWR